MILRTIFPSIILVLMLLGNSHEVAHCAGETSADFLDLDLDLHLGPPGIEVPRYPKIDWDGLQETLSPNFQLPQFPLPSFPKTPLQQIENNLLFENWTLPESLRRPLAEAEELLQLKGKIVQTMGELDKGNFWKDKRDFLLGHSLNNKNPFFEYSIDACSHKLTELETLKKNYLFYHKLLSIKIQYLRFYGKETSKPAYRAPFLTKL